MKTDSQANRILRICSNFGKTMRNQLPSSSHTPHTFSFQLTTHSKLANIVVANSLSYLVALWSLTCIVCLRIACQTLLDCPYYIATSYPTGIVAPQWMKQQQQQHNLLASNLVQFRIAEIFVNSYKRTNGEKCRPHSSAAQLTDRVNLAMVEVRGGGRRHSTKSLKSNVSSY